MPGFVVNAGSVVMCSHAGKATGTGINPRVKVMSQPVINQPMPWTVAGCAFPPPPVANGPCVTATILTGSLRLMVGSMPVVLQDSQSICVPTGTPLIIAVVQPRVKAM